MDPMARGLAAKALSQDVKTRILDRITRLSRSRYSNPSFSPAMTTPPTVTTSPTNPSATYPKQYTAAASGSLTANSVFRLGGSGAPAVFASHYVQFPATTCVSGGNVTTTNAVVGRVAFMIYAADFAFEVLSTSQKYRLIVDGQFVSTAGFVGNEAGGTTWVTVTFAAAGVHRIEVECSFANAFSCVRTKAADGCWAPTGDDGFVLTVMGDSFTASTGATLPGQGYARVLGDCLGVLDTRLSGAGGSGYVNTNSGTQYKLRDRLTADLITPGADLCVWAMGINDFDVVGTTTEIVASLAAFRAGAPTMPLVVLGAWSNGTGPTATNLGVEARITAAVTALNDPFVKFVPVSNDPSGAWCYNGSPTSDGTHPTDASHLRLGCRAADAVLASLKLMAA